MKPGKIVAIIAVVGLAGFLLWSTLGAQRAECRVCVEYGGLRNCATATAANEQEAARSAQNTACGPLARGMNSSIACGNQQPLSAECRTR